MKTDAEKQCQCIMDPLLLEGVYSIRRSDESSAGSDASSAECNCKERQEHLNRKRKCVKDETNLRKQAGLGGGKWTTEGY